MDRLPCNLCGGHLEVTGPAPRSKFIIVQEIADLHECVKCENCGGEFVRNRPDVIDNEAFAWAMA